MAIYRVEMRTFANKIILPYERKVIIYIINCGMHRHHQPAEGNDPTDLLKRIDKQHGTHTIDHAAQIGLGSKKYELINLDL